MRILVSVGRRNQLTETFIEAHLKYLQPAPVVASDFPPVVPGVFRMSFSPLLMGRFAVSWLRGLRPAHNQYGRWFHALCFAEILRRVQPDVVLAEFGPQAVEIMHACFRAGVPLAAHFHGADSAQRDILESMEHSYPELFAGASAIIVVSRAMRDRLIQMGAPEDRTYLNCYGVDCDLFCDADPRMAPPTFLSVGRFVNKKAPHLTILAFQRVVSSVPEARLRMIGDGPLLEVCRDLVMQLGIQSSVEFCGPQPPDQVQLAMRNVRGFVQHSVTAADGDCEGTPNSVLEAQASGLPVIATRHEGICDVVVDGVTGLLVSERDISGMADAIMRLCNDPDRAAELGAAGRSNAIASYPMAKAIEALQHILKSTATGH